MKQYKSRGGETLWKPSIEEIQEADADGEGFCLACGERSQIEPDAAKAPCPACGANKLYGAAELALIGLCY
jgi:hypothetical protein